jgi:hypothetical protein
VPLKSKQLKPFVVTKDFSQGGTEEDAAKRTPVGTANDWIYWRHITVAHIETGRYSQYSSQPIGKQEWKALNAWYWSTRRC